MSGLYFSPNCPAKIKEGRKVQERRAEGMKEDERAGRGGERRTGKDRRGEFGNMVICFEVHTLPCSKDLILRKTKLLIMKES